MSDEKFQRTLMYSLAGHLVLGTLIFVRAVFMPSEPLEIRNAIRVDVVGLPEKMTETETSLPPPKPEAAPESARDKSSPPPKPEKKSEAPKIPDPKAKTKDLVKSQKRALEELKRRDALDRIKDQLAKDKDKDKGREPGRQIRGNQVSAGNSLTGLDKLAYDRYFDELRDRMRASFSLPQWLADAGYKAQVQVLIDERGFVTKKTIVKSSGNEVFDAKAIEAVDASAPLPAPPQRLQGLLSTSGIIFGFPE